jgi:hypothetical protein
MTVLVGACTLGLILLVPLVLFLNLIPNDALGSSGRPAGGASLNAMKVKLLIAFALVAATGACLTASSASAAPTDAPSPAVRTVWRAAYSGPTRLACSWNLKPNVLGVANSYTREVRIDGLLCTALTYWWRTGNLNDRAMLGLIVTGHEAAHMRGVRDESAANCAGVNFAYRYMKQRGTFRRYDERKIAFNLTSNKDWPPAYKLGRTPCPLAFAID